MGKRPTPGNAAAQVLIPLPGGGSRDAHVPFSWLINPALSVRDATAGLITDVTGY